MEHSPRKLPDFPFLPSTSSTSNLTPPVTSPPMPIGSPPQQLPPPQPSLFCDEQFSLALARLALKRVADLQVAGSLGMPQPPPITIPQLPFLPPPMTGSPPWAFPFLENPGKLSELPHPSLLLSGALPPAAYRRALNQVLGPAMGLHQHQKKGEAPTPHIPMQATSQGIDFMGQPPPLPPPPPPMTQTSTRRASPSNAERGSSMIFEGNL